MRRAAIVAITLALTLTASASAWAESRTVDSAEALRAAIAQASPGDVITVAPGVYTITGNVVIDRPGQEGAPIVVRGASADTVSIRFDALEGFHVRAPWWTFEGLHLQGACASHDACEHAFHITGAADHTTIRGCRLEDFNAHIKGNGEELDGVRVWPDDVLIAHNELWDSEPRQTGNPVTPIDVVGGRRWVIRNNFIHDHAKLGSNQISYAAFLKGNSRDGLFERNLVICEWLHSGQIRLGLSFGGGGSGPDPICEDGTCNPEHQDGTMRNNIIASCPADVGIYLNEAARTRLLHNTLYDTTGIDVRFDTSSAEVRNNLVSGRIRTRDNATMTTVDNVEQVGNDAFATYFADPAALGLTLADGANFVNGGAPVDDVPDDFCGQPRDDGMPDLGAIEYTSALPCAPLDAHLPSTTPEPDAGPDTTDTLDDPPPDAADDTSDPGQDAADDTTLPDTPTDDVTPDTPDTATGQDTTNQPPSSTPNHADDGCACRLASPGHDQTATPLLALLAVLGLVWRARRDRR